MIFDSLKAAILLEAQREVDVPVVARGSLGAVAQQVERRRTLEGDDAQAMLDGFDAHLPSGAASRAVIVAVVHQRTGLKHEGRRTPPKTILDGRGIRALLHPDTLLQDRVRQRECPHRYCTFEVEVLDVAESLRLNDAARPAVGEQ